MCIVENISSIKKHKKSRQKKNFQVDFQSAYNTLRVFYVI